MTFELSDIPGLRVTLMGLGTRGGGTGVAKFFAEQGASVLVTDLRSRKTLQSALQELSSLPIDYVLESHRERDFLRQNTDLVIRNPAVPRNAPMLELARSENVPVHMEMSMFLQMCPAPVVGITGTKGKTSTAYLCSHILKRMDPTTILAGNMGVSALDKLSSLTPETPVVLEISNWQLEGMDEHRRSPEIGVLTNISEDHLNTYRNYAEYAAVKRSIARWMTSEDTYVVNGECQDCVDPRQHIEANMVRFSRNQHDQVVVGETTIEWCIGNQQNAVDLQGLPQYASHYQRMNAAAAIAAAVVRGASESDIIEALAAFSGIPDRNEFVAEVAGVTYINDTAATAPAAVEAVFDGYRDRRLHVIAGGSDKQVDLLPLARLLASRATTIAMLDGNATPELMRLLDQQGAMVNGPFRVMAEAVDAARATALPGDIVILSPGCASFGLFRDEFDRGQQFREAVNHISMSMKTSTQE